MVTEVMTIRKIIKYNKNKKKLKLHLKPSYFFRIEPTTPREPRFRITFAASPVI